MQRLLSALLLSLAAVLPVAVHAGPKADALANCLAENTTGKERKELARWVFIAMATHPDNKDLARLTDAARDDADVAVARLFTALLTERCKQQAREAMQQEGRAGMETPFQTLGGLAMRELMSNPEVAAASSGFQRYVDGAKIEAAISAK